YRGGGTYFYPKTQGGPIGACGPYEDNNSQIVALNAAQYGPLNKRSDWCGKRIKICHHERCTIATITDACPKCHYGGLDLTPAVWDQLYGDRSRGVLDIVWSLL
ncbi:RlpA-like double-psi beta-barrel-protein domain-containing protein-containing protein, partial [Blakeslea trispora]